MELSARKEYLLIDLTRRQYEGREIPSHVLQDYPRGMSLATFLLSHHQQPRIDSFASESVIVMSPGLLAGTPYPGATTCALAGKSPLTGFWAGGSMTGGFAWALARCGWAALVITGRSPAWSYVLVDEGRVFFRDATHVLGLSLRRTREELKNAWGATSAVLGIGRAGELQVRFSGLSDGSPGRGVRGGLGAVFGAKSLKAVVVRPNQGVPVQEPSAFLERIEATVKSLGTSDDTAGSLTVLRRLDQEEALPACNFQTLTSNDNWLSDLERLPVKKHACIGCPMSCLQTVPLDKDGSDDPPRIDLPLVPEHLWAVGPLLGLYSMKDISLILGNCLDLGLEPVSFGGVAAWVCECLEKGISLGVEFGGFSGFGDSSRLSTLPSEVVNDPEKRELLGLGAKAAAEKVGGAARALAVHFQMLELTYADPRRNFWPLSYLSPLVDLTTLAESMDAGAHDDNRAEYLIRLEDQWALWQVLGVCPGAAKAQEDLLESFPTCLNLLDGPEVSPGALKDLGKKLLGLVKDFDRREGWRPRGQHLAEKFFLEELAGPKALYPALDRESWYQSYREYFSLRGWVDDGEAEAAEES